MDKTKFQGSPGLTRYGKAGPPVQYSNDRYITPKELKARIKELNLKPEDLYSKEQIINDPKMQEHIETELLNLEMEREVEADKLKENDLIPGDDKPKKLTDEEKRKQAEENILIPDPEDKGTPGDSDDLIPD